MRKLALTATMSVLAFATAASLAADPANPNLRYYYPVPPVANPQTIKTDICVYGDTPAGITAAIQATRMGKTASLVVFGKHLGGMTSSGLSKTDGGKHAAGISSEFYAVVGKANFTPAAAEKQFATMLEQAGVKVYYEHRLKSVTKEGAAITEIAIENGNKFAARMFIDATYEGDLLAMAKVSYTVGREANTQYNETLNGTRAGGGHAFKYKIDPYLTPGDAKSGFLPGISNTAPDAPGKLGEADKHVQAYNFRMFLAKMPDAVPFPKPANYDPKRYELLRRYIAAGASGGTELRDFMQLHVGDSNNNGGFSTDHIGAADPWPDATYDEREKIYQDHVTYQQGFMYFLANDPGIPEKVRNAVSAFGLAKGNFEATGGWSHQLYIREARRMVSDYVMTEHNCRAKVVAEDSIGLAEYNMDSHNCQRYVVRSADGDYARNEGDVQVRVPHPYPVAYRAIVPKAAECTNLLVPVCLSATHIAYGSIRMEPVFMVLGQSAGTAASLAIDAAIPVQKVAYTALRERLLKDRQLLDYTPPATQK